VEAPAAVAQAPALQRKVSIQGKQAIGKVAAPHRHSCSLSAQGHSIAAPDLDKA